MKTFREYINEGVLDYFETQDRHLNINIDGIDFALQFYPKGKKVNSIGKEAYDTVIVKVISKENNINYSFNKQITGISFLATTQANASTVVVNTKKCAGLYNGTFEGINITAHSSVKKHFNELEVEKSTKKLIIQIIKQIKKDLVYISVEGALFFDNTQQSDKKSYSRKLKDLKLTIDEETKTVLEFSGNVISTNGVKHLISTLNNGSYIIEK